MKKIHKRNGFTLIEMVLVIAIIVILAIVVFFTVANYLNRAKYATEKMESHISVVESLSEQVENEMTP